MSPLVVLLVCLCAARGAERAAEGGAREEKLRSALIDAFQSIKKSPEGGLDRDLIGSVPRAAPPEPRAAPPDPFADEDGLSFADLEAAEEKRPASTERSHNVQHIVKAGRPGGVLAQLDHSIRDTVNESRLALRKELNSSEPLGIENMLRIFDADILVRQWAALQRALAGDCRRHVQLYVDGLRQRRLWALKMEDASGRYTSMFYWGNNYWTGSAELCDVLNHQQAAPAPSNKSSGSQIFAEWRQDVSMSGSGPPFRTAFYTVRAAVSSHLPDVVKTRRTLYLGLCLPESCSRSAVGALVGGARGPLLQHAVLAVRSPQHGGYTYLHDPTFQVLLAVSIIVGILLVTATAYDMQLAAAARRRRRHLAPPPADLKLQIGALDDLSANNGNIPSFTCKCVYNVNNNNVAVSNASEERLTADSASTSAEDEIKLSVWSELLLSFSMKANLMQIFEQSVGTDTVPCVHGLRSLSMLWVIFGHTCIVVFKYADNTALRAILEKSFWFQLILSAVYSVDTFFCLGGLLVSFLYFRTNAKGKLELLTKGRSRFGAGVLQFLGLIGYRFARLTAPYLFMLGVVEVTMKWFAHNAVFEPPALDHETCPRYWWRNLLYINTLFPVEQMCMLWSWYLSDDTQFYAVSAILLIMSTSHFKLSAGLTGVLFVSSLLTTGYVSWSNEHVPNNEDPFTQFDKIYDKPWTRLGPYLVGMFVGWILFKTNLSIRMSRIWAWVGWLVCGGTLLFLIFGLYRTELGVAAAAVYSALSHSLWAACIGWIILACSTGHGGWVRHILCAPVLYPFSRVTYCAYLVHPVVLRYVAMHLTHPIHLGELLVFVLFLGLAVISFFVALVISVAFEAPIVTMLKILSPQRKPHRL